MQRLRVYVYRNLHFKNRVVWSVCKAHTRELLFHTPDIILSDVKFKVSEAGRQRVIDEQRKNVHAGVEGDLVIMSGVWMDLIQYGNKVTYNPYKYETFVYRATEHPIESSEHCYLSGSGDVYV